MDDVTTTYINLLSNTLFFQVPPQLSNCFRILVSLLVQNYLESSIHLLFSNQNFHIIQSIHPETTNNKHNIFTSTRYKTLRITTAFKSCFIHVHLLLFHYKFVRIQSFSASFPPKSPSVYDNKVVTDTLFCFILTTSVLFPLNCVSLSLWEESWSFVQRSDLLASNFIFFIIIFFYISAKLHLLQSGREWVM